MPKSQNYLRATTELAASNESRDLSHNTDGVEMNNEQFISTYAQSSVEAQKDRSSMMVHYGGALLAGQERIYDQDAENNDITALELQQTMANMTEVGRRHLDTILSGIDSPALSSLYQELTGQVEKTASSSWSSLLRENTSDSHAKNFAIWYEGWHRDVAARETDRADAMYETFKQKVQILVDMGHLPRLPDFKGFDRQKIVIIDPIQASISGRQGSYDTVNGILRLRTNFSDITYFHESNHRDLGEFKGTSSGVFIPYNEALTQMVARAELNDGELQMQPPEDDTYIDEQVAIALLCEESDGIVDIKDWLAVHVAPNDQKDKYLLLLLSKLDQAYPGTESIFTESMENFNYIYDKAIEHGAKQARATATASMSMRAYLESDVQKRKEVRQSNIAGRTRNGLVQKKEADNLRKEAEIPYINIRPGRLTTWRNRRVGKRS